GGFNGVAEFTRRRAERDLPLSVTLEGFNGVAEFTRRRAACGDSRSTSARQLQWGRRVHSTKRLVASWWLGLQGSASMGSPSSLGEESASSGGTAPSFRGFNGV